MEKMKTVDVGYVHCNATMRGAFNDCFTADVTLVDLSSPDDLYDLNNERCYLVKKSDLDAYMARKEDLEQMNCTTPVWDEIHRLTAKVKALEAENANLRDINKSLKETITKYYYGVCPAECEIRKENERLKESICLFLSV